MKASIWFAVVGLAAGSVLTTDAAQSADAQRQYNAARYAIQIGANTAGWVSSVSSTQGAADVIETSRGGPRIKATGIVS